MNKIDLYSQEAENSLLGLVITQPSLAFKVIDHIRDDDFFFKENKLLFRAIETIVAEKRKIDPANLIDFLQQFPELSRPEWQKFVSRIMLNAGIESHLEDYIQQIKDKAVRRNLQEVLGQASTLVDTDRKTTDKLIHDIENKIFEITREREVKEFKTIKELTNEFTLKLEKQIESIDSYSTGIRSLDELIVGFKKSNLIIIAARPSMGKTAIALHLAKEVAKRSNVAFFSIEMPSDELMFRMLSSETMFDSEKLRNISKLNSNDRRTFDLQKEKLANLKLSIDDTPGLSINELMWKARKLKSENRLDVIFVDYLQIIQTDVSKDRYHQVSELSRLLKQISRELDVPVVALSQLSRGVEKRENKKPILSDLRESGAIEQDADVIMMLYREDAYDDNRDKSSSISELQIIIAKNRNGPIGDVKLDFNRALGIIKEKAKV